jgi:uncharacterized protein
MLWGGKPTELIQLAGQGQIQLFTSRTIIAEIAATLLKPKLASAIAQTGFLAGELIERYSLLTRVVRPKSVEQVSRDSDDDHIIACALAARADFLITGDDDLLVLRQHQGIGIISVAKALDMLVA